MGLRNRDWRNGKPCFEYLLRSLTFDSLTLALKGKPPQWIARTSRKARPYRAVRKTSDQFSLNGVHYGFKAIVRAEFLIDMVQMVAKSLNADAESRHDLFRFFAFGKEP